MKFAATKADFNNEKFSIICNSNVNSKHDKRD